MIEVRDEAFVTEPLNGQNWTGVIIHHSIIPNVVSTSIVILGIEASAEIVHKNKSLIWSHLQFSIVTLSSLFVMSIVTSSK